jgi:hypothetical protein
MNYLRATFCSIILIAGFGSASLPAIAQTMPSCPGDTVVWENTSTKVYHESGDKYFGKTKKGQYACKADADKAGYHLSGSKSKGGASSADTSTSNAAPAAAGAPSPSPSPSGKHHKHKKGSTMSAAPAAGAMPAPSPSPSSAGKHHHHKKGASASPTPAAT